MLTRNRGKFKSIFEFLGLKKKPKKSAPKAKKSTNSKHSPVPKSDKMDFKKSKLCVKKKFLQREISPIANSDEEKQLKSDVDFEVKPENSQAQQNCSSKNKTRYSHCSGAQKNSPSFPVSLRSDKAFKLCDSILQEILGEISCTGSLFRTRREFLANEETKIQSNGQERDTELQYRFKSQIQQSLFAKMTASLNEINEESDKKDAFLGSYCLSRPGIRKLLRLRREIRDQISKSSCTRRLRPNPRKRRYSDMISSVLETPRRLAGLSGGVRNVGFVTKKLTMVNLQAAFQKLSEPGCSRTSAIIDRDYSVVTNRMRPRRGINLHLDWKFCYESTLNSNEKRDSTKKHPSSKRNRVGDMPRDEDSDFRKEAPVSELKDQPNRDKVGKEFKSTLTELLYHQDMNRQLNPWDRVVLGLTCSMVSGSTNDEILIKQLHSSDLSILLQRINGSAFKIKGLSISKNANGEQEFNIVLSYKSKSLLSIGKPGKKTKAEEEDLNSFKEEKVASQLNELSDDGTRNSVKKKPQRKKSKPMTSPAAPYSALARDGSNTNKTANREWTSAHRNRGVARQPHPLQVLGLQHLRARAATSLMSKNSPDRFGEKVEQAGVVKSEAVASFPFIQPPFRRSAHRKVVRKVYTGTSMVPKILNRHRSSTAFNLSIQTISSAHLLPKYSHIQTASITANSDENAQLPQVQIAETVTPASQNVSFLCHCGF